jgi:cell fate regulator YaaT (PSP1 superfamily)
MGKIVGVKFQRGGKVYDFDAGHFVLALGDKVIVETEQGLALGTVVRLAEIKHPVEEDQAGERDAAADNGASQDEAAVAENEAEIEGEGLETDPATGLVLKKVYRLATEADLAQLESNAKLEEDAYKFCLERVAVRKMEMNLVKVESYFDRSKIIFFFTADGRLDFRELVRDLVGRFRTRIEMRQIGVRHEAKLLGGLGSCGRELCCATFLRDFEPVSVKMAKEQNLSLNPTKISGLCGRLMCCLTYEFEAYKSLKKGLPKLGKRFTVNEEENLSGKVIRQNVLKRQVTVILPDGRELTGTPEDLVKAAVDSSPQPYQPGKLTPQPVEQAGPKDTPQKTQPKEQSEAKRPEKDQKDEVGPKKERPRQRQDTEKKSRREPRSRGEARQRSGGKGPSSKKQSRQGGSSRKASSSKKPRPQQESASRGKDKARDSGQDKIQQKPKTRGRRRRPKKGPSNQ